MKVRTVLRIIFFQECHLGKYSLYVGIGYWQRQQSDGTQCKFFKARLPPSVFESFNLHPKCVKDLVTWEASWCDISLLTIQGVNRVWHDAKCSRNNSFPEGRRRHLGDSTLGNQVQAPQGTTFSQCKTLVYLYNCQQKINTHISPHTFELLGLPCSQTNKKRKNNDLLIYWSTNQLKHAHTKSNKEEPWRTLPSGELNRHSQPAAPEREELIKHTRYQLVWTRVS